MQMESMSESGLVKKGNVSRMEYVFAAQSSKVVLENFVTIWLPRLGYCSPYRGTNNSR